MKTMRALMCALTAAVIASASAASAVRADAPALPTAPGPSLELPDPGTQEHPYLFTQEHRDQLWWWNGTWLPQSVPSGAHLRIQLPGGPTVWHRFSGPDCRPSGAAALLPSLAAVTELSHAVLPNDGRIDGFSDLQQFDFQVDGIGAAVICLRPDPVPAHPEDIGLGVDQPVTYVLTVVVGIPQLSLPSL